jgi:ferredoxin-NADP reductase
MSTILEQRNNWHAGELAMHKLLNVPTSRHQNPTAVGFPASYSHRVFMSSLAAFGALDEQDRPWTTIWGGERGFSRVVAQGVLGLQSLVDRRYDPVVRALLGANIGNGVVVRPETGDRPRLMSGLSIDLETRDRVKLAGRMAVATVANCPDGEGREGGESNVGEAQLAMVVQESLGNCPKYLNTKYVKPHIPSPQLVSSTLPLGPEALELLASADMFFLSTTNGNSMDTNHRGGPPGFLRVLSNSASDEQGGVSLIYPEYSGNRLYQSLGNLHLCSRIGVAIPDFETSNVLYLTGETELLVGSVASAIMPHTKLAVKIKVHEAHFIKDGLPFRGDLGARSPYNPPLRRLATEAPDLGPEISQGQSGTEVPLTATLINRETLSASVSRFTFSLSLSSRARREKRKLGLWKAGQHITLDFSAELDSGYSHMRDDDPQSLNDDFVRTFTISSPPPPSTTKAEIDDGTELQITARKHGPATGLLWRHNIRVPLEIPVRGFAGDQSFRIADTKETLGADKKSNIFVAGGVGITPLLAQAPAILVDPEENDPRLTLLWSVRVDDIPLVVDTMAKIPKLAPQMRLFVTSQKAELTSGLQEQLLGLEREGIKIQMRRMMEDDVVNVGIPEMRRKYFVCAGAEMTKIVLGWLQNDDVVSENFNY